MLLFELQLLNISKSVSGPLGKWKNNTLIERDSVQYPLIKRICIAVMDLFIRRIPALNKSSSISDHDSVNIIDLSNSNIFNAEKIRDRKLFQVFPITLEKSSFRLKSRLKKKKEKVLKSWSCFYIRVPERAVGG